MGTPAVYHSMEHDHIKSGKNRGYKSAPYLTLAMDGITEVEDEGNAFHYERIPFFIEGKSGGSHPVRGKP